jgi:hypothetical protein
MSDRWVVLFRAELKRLWTGRQVRIGLALLLGALALQFAVGLLLYHLYPPGPGRMRMPTWVYFGSYSLGLDGFWTMEAQESLGLRPESGITGGLRYPLWLTLLGGIVPVTSFLLLPVTAASSIAADREAHRTEELLLAGFTPLEMLFGKGLAATAPYLALYFAHQLCEQVFLWSVSDLGELTPGMLASGLAVPVLRGIGFLAGAAIVVCVSALCRRQSTAIVACYGAAAATRFGLQVLVNVLPPILKGLLIDGIAATVLLLALLLLARAAIRALAEPAGTAGSAGA